MQEHDIGRFDPTLGGKVSQVQGYLTAIEIIKITATFV